MHIMWQQINKKEQMEFWRNNKKKKHNNDFDKKERKIS